MIANVLIRVDADNAVGFGHLKRCLVLADIIKNRKGKAEFLLGCGDEVTGEIVEQNGFSYHILSQDNNFRKELPELEHIIPNKTEMIVLDIVHSRTLADVGDFAFYLKKLKDYFKYIVLIDGSGKQSLRGRLAEISVDLLIVPYVGEKESSQALPNRVLAGPNYYILGYEYSGIRRRAVKEEANKLLITCGGSDPSGVTLLILDALKLIDDRQLDVRIVIGPYFQSKLKAKICSEVATIQHAITILNEPPNLAENMLWCDLAIANTGLTKYELAVTGAPALFLSIDQAHADVNVPFSMEKTGIDLGVYNSVSNGDIANKVCFLLDDFDMRKTMARNGQRLIDGHGAEKIIAEMELLKNAEIRI